MGFDTNNNSNNNDDDDDDQGEEPRLPLYFQFQLDMNFHCWVLAVASHGITISP